MRQVKIVLALIWGILVVIGMATELVTTIQALPVLSYLFLFAMELNKKKVKIWVMVLSGIMILTNISYWSPLDLILWGAVFGVYAYDK